MAFFSRNGTRMTLRVRSADLNRWRGLPSRFDVRWRCFLVRPSKPRSKNSSQNGSAASRNPASPNSSRHKSVAGLAGTVKRAADVILASAALVLLSPLLAIIALAVRAGDGRSVLYRQVRLGLNSRPFTIIKFRTMQEEAERELGPIWAV